MADRLDRSIRLRIFNALQRLRQEPTRGKPLRGPLANLYSFRVGDWRVVYEIHRDTITIVVVGVGHRREVYEMVTALMQRLRQ